MSKTKSAVSVVPDKLKTESTSYEPSPSDKKKLVETVRNKVQTERALAQLEVSYLAQKSQLVEKLTTLYKQQNEQSVDALKFGEKDLQKSWTLDEEKLVFTYKE